MRARRTSSSNNVFRLPDGTEDNDLHVQTGTLDGAPVIASVWEPDAAERAAIATGRANIELIVWGAQQPPVCIRVTREQPVSRPQRSAPGNPDAPRVWFELERPVAEALVNVVDHVDDVLPDDPSARRELELVRELRDALGGFLSTQETGG